MIRPYRPCWIALFFLLFPALPASGLQLDLQPEAPLPIDPAVTIGTLENGFTYYIRANARPEERAELRLVVNAGSILEDDDQRGLAHLVEHMAFNGTQSFEEQELVGYLESIGMRFGPDLNAYTSFDETVYMLTIPTDDAGIVQTAFQILEEWSSAVTFDPEEVDRERGVVLEEWRARLGAGVRLQDQQFPLLFSGSRYAERLPIGLPETLADAPHEALLRFYRDWYRPDLMAVIAVGDFDPQEIEALIRERFSTIPSPPNPVDRPQYEVPEHAETLVQLLSDPELTSTQIQIMHKAPTGEKGTVSAFRRHLTERLYDAMLNVRFQEISQQPDAPFFGAASGSGAMVRPLDFYALQAVVDDGGVLRGIEALLTESERVARHGFTQSELERQKLNLLRAYERAHAERDVTNSGSFANAYVAHFLSGNSAPGIEFEFEAASTLLEGISLEEVNGLVAERLTEENRVVLVSAPEDPSTSLPSEAEVYEVFPRVAVAQIAAYEDTTVDESLLAVQPTPAQVVVERIHSEIDVVEWRLANGVRVLVKATDFREDEVLFRGFAPGGHSLASDEDYFSATLAATLTNVSGAGPFSQQDLGRVLAGKSLSLSASIGELEQGVAGGASPRDLEALLQLNYLRFTEPRYDPQVGAALMQQMRASIANRSADPNQAFADTFAVTFSQGHPRALPPTLAELERVDPDVAYAFFRDRFSDASDFTFAFVGNVDLETLRPLVETYLGGLPSTGRGDSWRDIGLRRPPGVVERVVRQGVEPRAATRIAFWGQETFSRENVHLLRSLADVLDVRLRDTIREGLGGSYGVQVVPTSVRRPIEEYSLTIAFSADPGRLEELTDVVFDEIARLQAEGVEAQEVANVREMQRREREVQLRTNGFWIGQLLGYERQGFELADIIELDALLTELTPERIQQAARSWLLADNYVRVSLYPAEAP